MDRRIITVFGGSGFVGRHLVKRLADTGAIVRVAVRDIEAAMFLKPLGEIGQIVPLPVDVKRPDLVAHAVAGADAVVNLVGILSPWGRNTFDSVHAQGAETVAKAAAEAGVRALVHMSALGANPNAKSLYARTKAEGEARVRAAFPDAMIVRPSIIFGPEDGFFNLFAGLSRFSPVLPLVGGSLIPSVSFQGGKLDIDFYGDGGTRFQPVYVGDVAEAMLRGLTDPTTKGRTFELGGPAVYSFKELLDMLLAEIDRKRLILPVPFALASIEAWFLEKLPMPLLTRDQVTLLKTDNVVSEGANTLADLDIKPTSVKLILPTYLRRYRPSRRQGLRRRRGFRPRPSLWRRPRGVPPLARHPRTCPGGPRFFHGDSKKTWMPGTSPGTTMAVWARARKGEGKKGEGKIASPSARPWAGRSCGAGRRRRGARPGHGARWGRPGHPRGSPPRPAGPFPGFPRPVRARGRSCGPCRSCTLG